MTMFKKIFLKNQLTTFLNENGEEKKNLYNILPNDWNKENFNYFDSYNNHKKLGYGFVIKTGKENNITILDFDDMEAYEKVCLIYKDLYKHYSVRTRRGVHVYFHYNPNVKKFKIPKVDVLNNNKIVIGETTPVIKYNNEKYKYTYMGGDMGEIPNEIMDLCILKDDEEHEIKKYTSNIDYDYFINDDQIHNIIDELEKQYPDYLIEYESWLKFMTMMKTIDKYELFDETCKKYSGYSKSQNLKLWNSIKLKISPNYFCKLLKLEKIDFTKKQEILDSMVDQSKIIKMNRKHFYFPDEDDAQDEYKQSIKKFDDFRDNDVIIIQSCCASGKTSAVIRNYVQKYYYLEPHISILSIVPLRTVGDQQVISFRRNNIEMYDYRDKDANVSLLMLYNSIICINSLYKLAECCFKNKIIYIDEIYTLTQILTNNDTIHNLRLVWNTLRRAINECHKVIVSDHTILNSVMILLNERINDGESKTTHYLNEYKKFDNVEAIRYYNENKFFDKIKEKINNEGFCLGTDSKTKAKEFYNKIYDMADEETRNNMFLFIKDCEDVLPDEFNEKMIIIYSPKIQCAVDINLKVKTETFMYITGQSISSIALLQQSCRVRNPKQLSYFSKASCYESEYISIKDCHKKNYKKYELNCLGISEVIKKITITSEDNHDLYFNLYVENIYTKDYFKCNILKNYQNELTVAGFILKDDIDKYETMDEYIKIEMKTLTKQMNDKIFNKFIDFMNDDDNFEEENNNNKITEDLIHIKQRFDILNIEVNQINENRDLIQDEHLFNQFMNYVRLNKNEKHCKIKLFERINNKMIVGLENDVWNKISYIHMIAEKCQLKDDLFNLDKFKFDETIVDNKFMKLIKIIKELYKKRDTVKNYDEREVKKLYVYMLQNLTKKLKIIETKVSNVKPNRKKTLYFINENNKLRYDNLIKNMKEKYNITLDEDE
jgi:hypothetical protein